ncbi:DUF2780 domain-containing protein [Corallococcus exiguus]|uniref:DUF2780 domain-containing protein n=1 Tax=Corallococcus exiguus TaxID=83462 RepID=UPI00112405F1|nr:DUF2780 domain-containing protein [Corallococcus exiguus]TNV45602.1 DUF2780 domain-containing protein [Corallococcus exiguus]
MDLIGQLSQQLGVDGTQAQGLAGSLLKLVQGSVQEKVGPDAARQMDQAIPEMQGWQQQAQAPAGDGGGLMGALGGAAAHAGEIAGVVAILQRFNLDASKATLVAPLLLNFLKSRLDPGLVGKILAVMPMLAGGAGGGSGPQGGGGLGGMLGGILGK